MMQKPLNKEWTTGQDQSFVSRLNCGMEVAGQQDTDTSEGLVRGCDLTELCVDFNREDHFVRDRSAVQEIVLP